MRRRGESPAEFRRRFGVPGWTILAFWVGFGFLAGQQILLSMPTHGHSWGKMIGWQVGAAMGWAALTPLILQLGMRWPLVPRLGVLAGHLAGAVAVASAQTLLITTLAVLIDPYTPVVESLPFAAEYLFQLDRWLLLDVLLYFGIVAVGTGVESQRRQVREARLRAELAQAELRALRLELQPHFLFNALNAVGGLLEVGKTGEAERMLSGLSKLLRATLDAGDRPLVTVGEEMELARHYLDVQRVRFGDRLRVSFTVAAEAEALPVPNLLLQPLVENAVRHGVGRRAEGGSIALSAALAGGRLRLRVEDDGPGLPADWTEAEPSGHGLEHVSSRLAALYEDDWELELADRPGGGVAVEIDLPARPATAPAPAEAVAAPLAAPALPAEAL